MKKIIDGKKYNTETAVEIARNGNGLSTSDSRWFEESLYKKRTGEFFLCGEGGPLSRYADTYPGGGWTYGERIIPISLEEAMTWAESVMDVDDYEAEFGEVEE